MLAAVEDLADRAHDAENLVFGVVEVRRHAQPGIWP